MKRRLFQRWTDWIRSYHEHQAVPDAHGLTTTDTELCRYRLNAQTHQVPEKAAGHHTAKSL